MSLCALTLCDAAADIRDGRITSAELVGDCLERIDEVDEQIEAWTFLDRDHAMRQAEAADEHRRQGKAARPAARRAGRHQGHLRHRRHADRVRLGPVGRSHAAAGRGGRGPAARRRRGDHGQDRDHRVRLLPPGQDPQPARPRAHARRLLERLGRGRGGAHGAGRHRLADQRLGDPAGRVLRRRRLQADARPHPAQRRAAAVAHARSCRCVRAHRRGRSAARRDARRLRRGGSRHATDCASSPRCGRGERAALAAALRLRPLAGLEACRAGDRGGIRRAGRGAGRGGHRGGAGRKLRSRHRHASHGHGGGDGPQPPPRLREGPRQAEPDAARPDRARPRHSGDRLHPRRRGGRAAQSGARCAIRRVRCHSHARSPRRGAARPRQHRQSRRSAPSGPTSARRP